LELLKTLYFADVYGNYPGAARSLLLQLEHSMVPVTGRGLNAKMSLWTGSISVEHILPQVNHRSLRSNSIHINFMYIYSRCRLLTVQVLRKDSRDKTVFGGMHKPLLHKMGNLALLNRKDNSELSNLDFKDKKAKIM
jgi:hypothetical protein